MRAILLYMYDVSSSVPSLRPMALGKRRRELRGSVCDPDWGSGIGGEGEWVGAGTRSVCVVGW